MIYVLHHKESGFYHEFKHLTKLCSFINVDLDYIKKKINNMMSESQGFNKVSSIKEKKGFYLSIKYE